MADHRLLWSAALARIRQTTQDDRPALDAWAAEPQQAGMLAVAADSTRDETQRAVGVAPAQNGLVCALATTLPLH